MCRTLLLLSAAILTLGSCGGRSYDPGCSEAAAPDGVIPGTWDFDYPPNQFPNGGVVEVTGDEVVVTYTTAEGVDMVVRYEIRHRVENPWAEL